MDEERAARVEGPSSGPATPRPDICLVSGSDEIRLRSYVNHSIFAQLHGLDYRLECAISENVESRWFYKTRTIERVLPRYDGVAWLDDDAYVTDFSRDNFTALVERAEREGRFLVMAEGPLEPNGMWTEINAGVLLVKNCAQSRELLAAMTEENVERARAWWDEDAHGWYCDGDQAIIPWWLHTRGLIDDVLIVDHRELNSRGHYYEHSLSDAFVMHFCGYPDKAIGVVAFAEKWNIGQELVPAELLDRFHVNVRSPMGPVERLARTQAWHWRGRLKPYLKPARDAWRARRGSR